MELDFQLLDQDSISDLNLITEDSIIPESGTFLGLDISESSTGVCVYERGVRRTYNFSLNLGEKSVHSEALLRRCLKENLRGIILGKYFDVVIIEDVFQGINASTTRVLYALNTAIDEMILDEEVTCGKFFRVSNQTWKSWLYAIDIGGYTKGMNDKLRIETCLSMLGITESGEGFQDRLDATGMVLGYLIDPEGAEKKLNMKDKKKVSLEDVVFSYCAEDYDVFEDMMSYGIEHYKSVSEKRWSKSKIIEYLTEDPSVAYMTSEYTLLGNLADSLDLPLIEGGGLFAFWVKPNKINKYLK